MSSSVVRNHCGGVKYLLTNNGNFVHPFRDTQGARLPVLSVGSREYMNISVTIRNPQEPAYESKFFITIPETVKFTGMRNPEVSLLVKDLAVWPWGTMVSPMHMYAGQYSDWHCI